MAWDYTASEPLVDTVETILITKMVLTTPEDVLGPDTAVTYVRRNVGGDVIGDPVVITIIDRAAYLVLLDTTDALAPRASLIAHTYAQMVTDAQIAAGAVV